MKGERELVNKIRSVMEPVNPVPVSAFESDTLYQADVADRIAELRLSEHRFSENGLSQDGLSENGYSADGGPRRASRPRMAGRPRGATRPRMAGRPRGATRRRGVDLPGWPGRAGWPAWDRARPSHAWRVTAPVLSGLAVAAVVVILTLAGGSTGRSAGQGHGTGPAVGTAAGLPRYYVTINNKGFLTFKPSTLIVHSTLTGKTIASLKLPKSKGLYGWVTAAKSDREFFIVGDRTPGHFLSDAGLYRLRLARNGHVTSFTTLSSNLGFAEADNIDGIALSPDGANLAVAVEITHGYTPQAEIAVIPLDHHAPRRVWIDRQFGEYTWFPVWTSNKDIAFLWWDHLKKPYVDFVARIQERLLNTA